MKKMIKLCYFIGLFSNAVGNRIFRIPELTPSLQIRVYVAINYFLIDLHHNSCIIDEILVRIDRENKILQFNSRDSERRFFSVKFLSSMP